MDLIKKFFADKSRIAILSVCLLMLSVVMVSALTEDTLAISYCYKCLGNEHVFKWSPGSAPTTDLKCSTRYVYDSSISESYCKTYTIKYKANGGNGAPVDQYKASGKNITLSSTIPKKSGYTFQGWAKSSTATTVIYKAGDTYKVNDDITLYAVWRKNGTYACYQCSANARIVKWDTTNKGDSNCSGGYHSVGGVSQESNCYAYSIEYNANGGTGVPAVQYNANGKAINLSSKEPTKDGYTFLGWSINSNYNVPNYKPGDIFSNSGGKRVVTLYAVWEKNSECYKCETNENILRWKSSSAGDADCSAGYARIIKDKSVCNSYTITYRADGAANVPGVQHKPHGVTISLSTKRPTKKGYTFEGWSTSSGATSVNYEKGANFSLNKKTTLYAVWSKIEVLHNVKIKYNPVGGEVAASTDAGSWKVVDNLIYKNDNLLTTVVEYGDRLGENGLIDYYSGANLKVTKTGYSAELGEEWICLEGCTTSNKVFNQVDDYSASEFCDASKSDCEVTLGVNWQVSKVNIKYNTNGGVFTEITDNGNKRWSVANDALYLNGSLHKTTIEYGGKLGVNGLTDYNSFANLYITKAGRIAKPGAEWLCAYGDCEVGKTYSQKEIYSASDFCDASKGNCTAVLGVNWIKNKVSINYNPYGGIVEPSTNGGTWKVVDDMIYKNDSLLTTTVEYYGKLDSNGLIDYYSGENLKITRMGHSVKNGEEWVCISGDCLPGKVYSHATSYDASDFCDTTYADCSVILGVNWHVNNYTVKYNANGGSGTMSDSEYTYGIAGELRSNNFTRSGYSFVGWNTKADGSGTEYVDGSEISIDSDLVLYAQWSPSKVYITYNTNGGTIKNVNGYSTKDGFVYKDDEVFEMIIDYGKTTSDNGLSDYDNSNHMMITKEGYFAPVDAEWICVSGDCVVDKVFSQSKKYNYNDFCDASDGECSAVLGVNWKPNQYTIVYSGNGSTSGSTTSSSHEYDVSKNLTKNGFVRTGYTFAGWNTAIDGSGTSYTDEQSVNNLSSTNNATVTLYAKWTADKYTVKYDANGGIGTMADSTYTYGVSKGLTANSFTRENYTFKYWNTKADGTGVNYTDKQSIKISENLTLYAQWKSNDSAGDSTGEEETVIKYYIHYDKNGGIGTMKDSEHIYDFASNLRENAFIKMGYIFNGWNTQADGTGTVYTDGQTISNLTSKNGDVITLYAQWMEIPTEDGDGNSSTPEAGGGTGNNNGSSNKEDNDKIESPQTGMLATILVSLICIGSLGGIVYYRKKVKN